MSGENLYHQPTVEEVSVLRDLATKLRIHSVRMTLASKSGHPTSCSSMAELMSVLFFKVMKYKDPKVHKDQRDPANDRFVLSKGHAAPILYAAWAEAGLFPVGDLLNLRKIDSDLEVLLPKLNCSIIRVFPRDIRLRAFPSLTLPPARLARGCPWRLEWLTVPSTSTRAVTAPSLSWVTGRAWRVTCGRRSTSQDSTNSTISALSSMSIGESRLFTKKIALV